MSYSQVFRKALGLPAGLSAHFKPTTDESRARLERLPPELVCEIMEYQLGDDPHDVQNLCGAHSRFRSILNNHKNSLLTLRGRELFGVNYGDALAVVRCPIREIDEDAETFCRRIRSHVTDWKWGAINNRQRVRDLDEYEALFQLEKSVHTWITVWSEHPWDGPFSEEIHDSELQGEDEDRVGSAAASPEKRSALKRVYCRFQRGFLRYEHYCRAFYQQPSRPLLTNKTRRSLFFDRLPPWQQEEVACVMSFVCRYYEMRVDRVREHFLRDLQARLKSTSPDTWQVSAQQRLSPFAVWPETVSAGEVVAKLGYLSEFYEVNYDETFGFMHRPHVIKTGFSTMLAMGLDGLERVASWDTDVFGQKLKDLWPLLHVPPDESEPPRCIFAHDLRFLCTPWARYTDELARQMEKDPLGCPPAWQMYNDFAVQSAPKFHRSAHVHVASDLRIEGWVFLERAQLEVAQLVEIRDLINVSICSWLVPDHGIFHWGAMPCRVLRRAAAEELLSKWGVRTDQGIDHEAEVGLNVESRDGSIVRFWEL